MNTIIYNGITFYETAQGYYLGTVNNKPKRLHRYVWETEIGPIYKGYDIHHIDGNKANNDLYNLQMVRRALHHHNHSTLTIQKHKEEFKERLDSVRYKAIEWHKSEAGREWHKKQYDNSLGKYQTTYIDKTCEVCGKPYKVNQTCANRSRFCSNKCKSYYRRHSGVDDIDVTCAICHKPFRTNKYAPATTCSHECEMLLRKL